MRRVVVTGIGALTPIGNNLEDYWKNIQAGVSGAGPITKFDASKHKAQFACELKGYDPKDHFDVKEIRKYDPFSQYALVAVDQALKHGNIDLDNLNKNRIGVIWGSGNGGIQTFQDQMKEYTEGDGTPRFSPFFIPRIPRRCPTNFYIFKQLEGLNIKTSTIARGIGVGDELEYADEVTLGRSIINRIPFDNAF